MPSPVEERDLLICQRYETEDISTERLGIEFRLSDIRIKQILKAGGVSLKNRAPGLAAGDKTLSATHVKIGKKVHVYRSLTLGVERSYFGEKIGWSPQKVASVEKGTFNLTLLDLNDIAKITGETLSKLLDVSTMDNTPSPTGPPSNNPTQGD